MTDRAPLHSREVVEADRAELIRKLREPIDRGAGTFGEDGYRPPMQAEACLGCGSNLYGGELPSCGVCGMETPWRQEFGRILDFERRVVRHEDRAFAIREAFGISPTTYELRLSRMLTDPRALTVDAVTVRRLIRRRDDDSSRRVATPTPRPERHDPRQRPLSFPSRPGNQSPASVPTSTPSGAEDTAESRATETGSDRPVDDVAAAGDTFFPTSEGVGRVEGDRVWGRRDRLQRLRPLGEHLRILAHALRDLWRGIC